MLVRNISSDSGRDTDGGNKKMWIIQLVLSLVIPVVLISGGRKYIRNMPAYGEKRFLRFHSRRAAVSEEAWNFANNLYAHMLYSSGISIGAVTVIFFLVASRYIHHTWILCFSLMAVQLAGSIMLPAAVCEFMLRRTYGKDGLSAESDFSEGDIEDTETTRSEMIESDCFKETDDESVSAGAEETEVNESK